MTDGDGYGKIRVGGESRLYIRTHRAAWELANGPIPAGMVVRHRCDNRRCVRPGHLELGTEADNQRHKAARRRGVVSKIGLPYGVHVSNGGRQWKAEITSGNIRRYFGSFPTIEQAAEVAKRERERLYGPAPGGGKGEAAA